MCYLGLEGGSHDVQLSPMCTVSTRCQYAIGDDKQVVSYFLGLTLIHDKVVPARKPSILETFGTVLHSLLSTAARLCTYISPR